MDKQIFYNGMITTLDETWPQVEALYTENGRIMAIGSAEEIMRQFGRTDVTKIDLDGGYAYPGFVDSHLHIALLGAKLDQLDLSGCKDKDELLATIRTEAAQIPLDQWIIGYGWNDERMEGRMPDLAELNQASLGRPLLLSRVCEHVYLVNEAAYRRAELTEEVKNPSGGIYGRDPFGKLNGWVYDQAVLPFQEAQKHISLQQRRQQIERAMKMALKEGLTGIHTDDLREIGSLHNLIDLYRDLHQKRIGLRTHHLIYYPYVTEWDELDKNQLEADEWFSLGAVKIFADGTFGGRTAWLTQPYADDPEKSTGISIHSVEELHDLAKQATNRGLPIAIHAIGDQAIEETLTVMQKYRSAPGKSASPLRHRLIHALLLRQDLLEQLKQMPIAVDIQPHFVASDFPWVERRLGEERLRYAYAWRSMIEAEIQCAGGSDAPIEPLSPIKGFYTAVFRHSLAADAPKEGYLPKERLNRLQALQLYTKGSAYAANEEHQRGTLSVGKQADISVFDHDLLTVEDEELRKATAIQTIVNGQIVYER
ncbi:hypothetical protein SAMN05444392_102469 [Seinonella peptonophila]|uniref:Amidohydrolase 3 domain-containing protein n=2 Tax=Seinonella peptonophila TaxID=112248 RepID=A0A1M4VQC3_9BACL|nr:hypothetical protein SAMN05444392_102469 [Seinonella peptonophila]